MGVLQGNSNEERVDMSGKRKRKKNKTTQALRHKKGHHSSEGHLTEEIPWEAMCKIEDEIPIETPLIRDNQLNSNVIKPDPDMPCNSADSDGTNNVVDSVIEGYIKVLQGTGSDL
jgi:hypothetical protein